MTDNEVEDICHVCNMPFSARVRCDCEAEEIEQYNQ